MVAFVAVVEHLIAQNDTISIIRFAPVQSNRCFILSISNKISWTAWCCRWEVIWNYQCNFGSEKMALTNNTSTEFSETCLLVSYDQNYITALYQRVIVVANQQVAKLQ